MNLRQEPNLSDIQLVRLEHHWDDKLSPGQKNPYPLAPKDLVKGGRITQENYQEQNKAFGDFSAQRMRTELGMLPQSSDGGNRLRIEVLGAGLARDLGWIPYAVELGFRVNIRDISNVATDYAIATFKQLIHERKIDVINGEVEEMFADDMRLTSDGLIAYFASQFFQVQPKRKMRTMLQRIGQVLGANTQRRLFMIHPFDSDNNTATTWGSETFPAVEWGDTRPYEGHELRRALQKQYSGIIDVETVATHHYFHQRYSFLKIYVKS
jgi:hypothetical protein